MDALEEYPKQAVVPEPPLDNLTEALIRSAVHQDLAADRRESLRSFCLREDMPDDVLLELYERQHFLSELAHRKRPRWLLERIARETRYPEAVITLAVDLYTSDKESAAEFQAFLQEHADHCWMLESLAHQRPSSDEKKTMFLDVAARHSAGERILRLFQVEVWERQAKWDTSPAELARLYETREPKVWRSLASNPAAPPAMLEQLMEARDMPLARKIRSAAKATLARASRS